MKAKSGISRTYKKKCIRYVCGLVQRHILWPYFEMCALKYEKTSTARQLPGQKYHADVRGERETSMSTSR